MKYEYESITPGIFRFTIPGEHRTVELFIGSRVIVEQKLSGNYLKLLRLVKEIPDPVKKAPAKKTAVKKTTTQKAKVADKITAVTETEEVLIEEDEVEVQATDKVVAVKQTKAKPVPKRRGRKKKED